MVKISQGVRSATAHQATVCAWSKPRTLLCRTTRGNAPETRKTLSDTDLHPPRPLTAPAREIFDRHAQRIDTEGRWNAVDHDLLAAYADLTTALGLGTCIDATKTEATIGTRSSAISTCIPALRRVGRSTARPGIHRGADLAGDRSDVARPLRLAAAVRPVSKCRYAGRLVRADTGWTVRQPSSAAMPG